MSGEKIAYTTQKSSSPICEAHIEAVKQIFARLDNMQSGEELSDYPSIGLLTVRDKTTEVIEVLATAKVTMWVRSNVVVKKY